MNPLFLELIAIKSTQQRVISFLTTKKKAEKQSCFSALKIYYCVLNNTYSMKTIIFLRNIMSSLYSKSVIWVMGFFTIQFILSINFYFLSPTSSNSTSVTSSVVPAPLLLLPAPKS